MQMRRQNPHENPHGGSGRARADTPSRARHTAPQGAEGHQKDTHSGRLQICRHAKHMGPDLIATMNSYMTPGPALGPWHRTLDLA